MHIEKNSPSKLNHLTSSINPTRPINLNDALSLSDREIQVLFQRCDLETIYSVVKSANGQLKAKFQANLSPRIALEIDNRLHETTPCIKSLSEGCQKFILHADTLNRQKLIYLHGLHPSPQPGPLLSELLLLILSNLLRRCDNKDIQSLIRDTNKVLAISAFDMFANSCPTHHPIISIKQR